ncbi:MAG: hypothetical protein WCJ11_06640 [Methylococcaceae bacterium]
MNENFTIQITKSTLDNHRIYFDRELHAKLFPNDCFGERETGGKRGKLVTFIAGRHKYETDIVNKNGGQFKKRINPRCSFGRYLSDLEKDGATTSDMLKMTKIDDRLYRVDFVRK